MNNIDTYIEYYKDKTFTECLFNDIDNLIFSMLAYLPIENEAFKTEKKLSEVEKLLSKTDVKKLSKTPASAINILKQISTSKRFEEATISNPVSILNNETQFSAITIRFGVFDCYVSFKGTDTSIIGWKENFDLSYKYPTPAVKFAIDYLQNTIKFIDKNIYVGGHSKGGNLAMASSMSQPSEIFNKIKHVYNNDGPGFLDKEFESEKYKRMAKKLTVFVPEESVVGILLNNSNVSVIKSSAFSISQHYPTTWQCFGQFLIKGKLSASSEKIRQELNEWINDTTTENREMLINTFFDVLKESKITDFKQLSKLKPSEINEMFNKTKNIDDHTKNILLSTIKMFFKKPTSNK